MENAFIRPDESYQRDLDIISGYYDDSAKYLQLQTGMDLDVCREFVKREVSPKTENGFKDPTSLVIGRNEVGDRIPVTTSFMGFLQTVKSNNYLLSPSMAVYHREETIQSRDALYIEGGVKNRKIVKGEMLEAKRNGDAFLAEVKNGIQQNLKTNNNSYSGATVSLATILYHKSTHSSLTSTCRTATSYANAANEKFLAGNRHYYSPEIVKSNLINLINVSDIPAIDRLCQKYNLHYPTTDDVLAMVERSTEMYWGGMHHKQMIRSLIDGMLPAERAAVLYVADLYHLHLHNREFVEHFLRELSSVGDETVDEVTDAEFKAYDGDIKLLANFLTFDTTEARNVDELKEEAPHYWGRTKATGKKALRTLTSYSDLIQLLWLSDTVPSSIHAFPSAYRRVAVISDTDSTMFTMQYWVKQLFGKFSFSVEAKRVVFAIVFLVSELIAHILAIQSANMGVSQEKLRLLSMKNEYYFAVLSMTFRSKHYYASRDAQEGVMFKTPDLEVKGVGLRDSKVPKDIMDRAKGLMLEIIELLKSEKMIPLRRILRDIGDIERELINSIEEGSPAFLTTGQIKPAGAYKQGEDAVALQQYYLWKEVFGEDFGEAPPPPYSVVKVSLRARNKTELEEWCASMDNQRVANKLRAFLKRSGRNNLTTLQIPAVVVESGGVPKDIVKGADIRKMVFSTTGVFYLMLEPLGQFMMDKRINRLVSDFH